MCVHINIYMDWYQDILIVVKQDGNSKVKITDVITGKVREFSYEVLTCPSKLILISRHSEMGITKASILIGSRVIPWAGHFR